MGVKALYMGYPSLMPGTTDGPQSITSNPGDPLASLGVTVEAPITSGKAGKAPNCRAQGLGSEAEYMLCMNEAQREVERQIQTDKNERHREVERQIQRDR